MNNPVNIFKKSDESEVDFIFWFKLLQLSDMKRSWTVCVWTCLSVIWTVIWSVVVIEIREPPKQSSEMKILATGVEFSRTEWNVIKTGGKPKKSKEKSQTHTYRNYHDIGLCEYEKRSTTFMGTCTLHCNPMIKRRRKRSVVIKREEEHSENRAVAAYTFLVRKFMHTQIQTHLHFRQP